MIVEKFGVYGSVLKRIFLLIFYLVKGLESIKEEKVEKLEGGEVGCEMLIFRYVMVIIVGNLKKLWLFV